MRFTVFVAFSLVVAFAPLTSLAGDILVWPTIVTGASPDQGYATSTSLEFLNRGSAPTVLKVSAFSNNGDQKPLTGNAAVLNTTLQPLMPYSVVIEPGSFLADGWARVESQDLGQLSARAEVSLTSPLITPAGVKQMSKFHSGAVRPAMRFLTLVRASATPDWKKLLRISALAFVNPSDSETVSVKIELEAWPFGGHFQGDTFEPVDIALPPRSRIAKTLGELFPAILVEPEIPTPGATVVTAMGVVKATSQSPIAVGAVNMDLSNGAYSQAFTVDLE